MDPNELYLLLAAQDKAFDTIGVVLHHDAITGTAKQYVSDDYMMKMYDTQNAVYQVYADYVAKVSGLLATEWKWCQRNQIDF